MIETKEAEKNRETVDVYHPGQNRASNSAEKLAPLSEKNQAQQFHTLWLEIQSRFVDDPGVSVEQADELVNRMIKNLTTNFAAKRMSLEKQWKNGDKVSTEDLRVALKQYRALFDRLLSLES